MVIQTESRFFFQIQSKNIREGKKKLCAIFLSPEKQDDSNFLKISLDLFGLFIYLSVSIIYIYIYIQSLPLYAIRRIQSTCKCPGSLYRGKLLPCRISAGQSRRLFRI